MGRIADIIAAAYLREGSVRPVIIGPYWGIRYELSSLMVKRREVYYRAYEPNVTMWLRQVIVPGMVVYVAGAHLGIHVLMIAKLLHGIGHVYAFEGWVENYRLLVRNIACNPRLSGIISPYHLAVGGCSGMQPMMAGPSDGRHRLATAAEAVDCRVVVPATTLDDFWSLNSATPDVILLDIEGFELEALIGAQDVLAKCRPRLVVEHHRRQERLTEWLRTREYSVEHTDRRHLFATSVSGRHRSAQSSIEAVP